MDPEQLRPKQANDQADTRKKCGLSRCCTVRENGGQSYVLCKCVTLDGANPRYGAEAAQEQTDLEKIEIGAG